jgi:hypothetical protein
MRQQLRLRVLVPVAVLGLLGAGFGAFAMGGPAAPESIPVHPTSSSAVDTGATDTGMTETTPPASTTTEAAPAPTAQPKPKPKPKESPLEEELADDRIVVVVFHNPSSDLDAAAIREARAGADAAGAGYLAVDVTDDGAVADLAVEYEVIESPTVLVVVRSGEARSRFDGIVDRETVAQAVTNALK